jgi:lipopolysaccharide/colanic/teichoic acid biosynthesis glycosyltransferase
MSSRLTALLLVVLDVIASIAVFNLISYARGVPLPDSLVVGPLMVPIGALVAAIYLVQGYWPRTDMLSVDYASQHSIAALGAMVGTLLLTYVVFPAGYELQSSRFVIALSFVTLALLTLSYRRLLYLRTTAKNESKTLVFVGDRDNCEAFREECARMGTTQRIEFSVVGGKTHPPFSAPDEVRPGEAATAATSVRPFVAPESRSTGSAASDQGEPRPFSDILAEIQNATIRVEAIVLRESARELEPEIADKLVRLYFAGVPTYTLELFHEVYWQKIPLYRLNQTWLFQEGFKIAREPVFERAKRVTDILLSTTGLVLGLPLMALCALAIWLEDRESPIFTQTRIGRNHVPFKLLKLRSMRTGSGGDRYTLPGDTRITRVGKILRSTRLDEIPQLVNVLRGDMSLIGPRAEWDQLVAEYELEIPCYHFRHLVRPGITGWAQVNYPYGSGIGDTLRKLEYDLYYVRHFSFRLDATIVLKTIHIMLFGKGR